MPIKVRVVVTENQADSPVDGDTRESSTESSKEPSTADRPAEKSPKLSWALILGSIAAAATLAFTAMAVSAPFARPDAEISVTVDERLAQPGATTDGGLPIMVSQVAVEAALEMHEVRGYQPLSMHFSADAAPEALDALHHDAPETFSTDADVTVYLGDPVLGDRLATPPNRIISLAEGLVDFGGNMDIRLTVAQVLQRSLNNGQEAAALAAAAQTAAHMVHPAPRATVWTTGAGISLAVMLLACFRWYRLRSRWEADQRRFAASRTELARIVLDLEALEVSYRTAEAAAAMDALTGLTGLTSQDGTLGIEHGWDHLQQEVRALQAEETSLLQLADAARPISRKPQDEHRCRLETFIDRAGALTSHTRAWESALAVSAGRPTAARALRELLAPVFSVVTELTTRIDDALEASPRRTRLAGTGREQLSAQAERLRVAHREMLRLSAAHIAGQGQGGDPGWRDSWAAADAGMVGAAHAIRRTVEPHGGQPAGSDAEPSTVRALRDANQAVRRRFGDHRQLDGSLRSGEEASTDGTGILQRLVAGGRLRTLVLGVAGMAVVVVVGAGAGSWAAASLDSYVGPWDRPTPGQIGDERLGDITVHDPAGLGTGLSVLQDDAIREHLVDRFTEPVDLVIAVRDLDEVDWSPHPDGGAITVGYGATLEAVWEIKAELAEDSDHPGSEPVVDPVAGEIIRPHVVLPVFVQDGTMAVFPPVTGSLLLGENTQSGGLSFPVHFTASVDEGSHGMIAYRLEVLSRDLASNAVFYDQTDPGQVFRWVALAVVLLGAAALQVLHWIGSLAAGLGRWGRQATRLREAQDTLNRLFLEEDARDFAMAVSRTDADDAAHGLTHQMLLWCARTLDELRLAPRTDRHSRAFAREVDLLLQRLDVLTVRHHNTMEQMDRLLWAGRAEGPAVPGRDP